jgi:hypothetical protein
MILLTQFSACSLTAYLYTTMGMVSSAFFHPYKTTPYQMISHQLHAELLCTILHKNGYNFLPVASLVLRRIFNHRKYLC